MSPKHFHVRSLLLTIKCAESESVKVLDKSHDAHLSRSGFEVKHAFPGENPPDRQPVHTADQTTTLIPCFNGMSKAQRVQLAK